MIHLLTLLDREEGQDTWKQREPWRHYGLLAKRGSVLCKRTERFNPVKPICKSLNEAEEGVDIFLFGQVRLF